MTNTIDLNKVLEGEIKLLELAKKANLTQEIVNHTKEIARIEAILSEETTKEEVEKEFNYYTVWGKVNTSEKAVYILGKEVEVEIVEGLGAIVKPVTIKNILEDWGMEKSIGFYQKLASKVQKMIREMN